MAQVITDQGQKTVQIMYGCKYNYQIIWLFYVTLFLCWSRSFNGLKKARMHLKYFFRWAAMDVIIKWFIFDEIITNTSGAMSPSMLKAPSVAMSCCCLFCVFWRMDSKSATMFCQWMAWQNKQITVYISHNYQKFNVHFSFFTNGLILHN